MRYYATLNYMFISKAFGKKISYWIVLFYAKSITTLTINLSSIVCYELSEGESEKEGIYFERNAFGARSIIKTPKHCRSALPRSVAQSLFRFVSFRGLGSVGPSSPTTPRIREGYVTQLTDEDEYFTCKRTVTKQRTALAAEAMHSMPRRNTPTTKHVLGVASQFCPDVHAAHCNMVLYTAQNILHESPGPFCSANGVCENNLFVRY